MKIKVGLLFSISGTTSITEKGQYDAARFAIEQYQKKGYEVEAITRDIGSNPNKAVQEAETLAKEGIKVFVGCYTSACRKAVLPVLEKYNCLLVYPTLYEGQEVHPNVLYTGEVPNQQVHTLIDYLMSHYGNRIYLLGNDYIYPRETNEQVKAYVKQQGGEIVEEKYVPFGHREFSQITQDIILKEPDVVFSTLVGKSVVSFYQEYHHMGLNANTIPIFSPITKETELEAMGPEYGVGHYGSASYFQSLDNELNKQFVKEFKEFCKEDTPISSVMFNTYIGTDLLLEAIIKTNSCDYNEIFQYIGDREKIDTACGELTIDMEKRHLSRPIRVGKAMSNGQFKIVWDSDRNIQPYPYTIKQSKKISDFVLNAWGQISEEAIIALTEKGTIQYMSREAMEMTGLQTGEIIDENKMKELENSYEMESFETSSKTLLLLKQKRTTIEPIYKFGIIQTKSPAFQAELETATIAAQSTANVLITGETGTGKEVMARMIHEQGERKDGPFIAVNTGAIPKDLITSELFGYVEGTFTGAKRGGSIGKFESAHNGTLFLDEIGDMPLDLQVTLLRAIETKRIIRLGESKEREVDIRIIAATNRNLEEEIAYENSFRSDLYYRLNVLSMEIPPLRERPEDIEGLAWRFMNEFKELYGNGPKEIHNEVMQHLVEYPWPGNIRELRNMIERAFLLARGKTDTIVIDHLPKKLKGYYNRGAEITNEYSLKEVEKQLITKVMQETSNINEASKKLGIGRSTLYRKLKEFEISI